MSLCRAGLLPGVGERQRAGGGGERIGKLCFEPETYPESAPRRQYPLTALPPHTDQFAWPQNDWDPRFGIPHSPTVGVFFATRAVSRVC